MAAETMSRPERSAQKTMDKQYLKGQCHEDFAVLGQFWAKIITLRLYS